MKVQAPDVFKPVLDRLHADAVNHFGVGALRLEPVRYDNREFSHLLRVAVYEAGNGTAFTHLFVKMTKPKLIDGSLHVVRSRVVQDFETTKRVQSSMSSMADVGVLNAVVCYPEHLAVVTEEVAGPTLLQYLSTGAAWFPASARLDDLCATASSVGRWIRLFQATAHPGDVMAGTFFREYIDHRLKRLVMRQTPEFAMADRDRVLRHVDSLFAQVPPAALRQVPIHSDLALGNILVNGRRIVVLDFTMAKSGAALHDLARLSVQMDLLTVKPQLRASVIRSIQTSLMAGYQPGLTFDDPLFRLLTVLHRVNHLVTVVFQRTGLLEAAYNWLVARRHYQWLIAETNRSVSRLPHLDGRE